MSDSAPTRGFLPVCDDRTHTVVLGSLPSRRSIASGEYYGHPRNAFWPLMTSLLDLPPDLDYRGRTAALLDAGVGLWDVLRCSQRRGSLDANIDLKSARPNDFSQLLSACPRLARLCFNGSKAAELFHRFDCMPEDGAHPGIERFRLPSTSPAFAAMSFADKRRAWAAVIELVDGVR